MSEVLNPQEETIEGQQEIENSPRDITEEFLTMSAMEFLDFLHSIRKEPNLFLSITVDWQDGLSEYIPVRLKAFLEDSDRYKYHQKRTATIRATEEQKDGSTLGMSQNRNAFASGVKWEKIED